MSFIFEYLDMVLTPMLGLVAVIDPHVTYEGLKRQALCEEDPGCQEDYLKQINYAVNSL